MDLRFTAGGLLPYAPDLGPIRLSLEEIQTDFCWNPHREFLYAAWQHWIRKIAPAKDSLELLVFGSFVTSKEEPRDIDCLVIVKNLDDPKLAELKKFELWTVQNIEAGTLKVGCVPRVQPLAGLVDAYLVQEGKSSLSKWLTSVTTQPNGERCGFVVVQL